jgi:hypothetical protein
MLDADLAALYGVPTKALVQAVKRNLERFPGDFMFHLTEQEVRALRSQIVTLDDASGRGRGRHAKYLPHALRGMIAHSQDLARKLDALESKYDRQFKVVFDAMRELMAPPPSAPKRRIGFVSDG